MRTYCIAQGILLNNLLKPIRKRNLKKNGYMYICVYVCMNQFALYLKAIQPCKSTIL